MRVLSLDTLPIWGVLLCLAAHFAVGFGLGIVFFRGLWWNVRAFVAGGRVTASLVVMGGRFALLVSLLLLASLSGGLSLILMALGLLLGRAVAMRHVQGHTP